MRNIVRKVAIGILLVAAIGCARLFEYQVDPRPRTPELKELRIKQAVFLEPFEDVRKGIEAGPVLASWRFVDRQSVHIEDGETPLMIISMVGGKEPKQLVREQILAMLQRAGVEVLEGEGNAKPGMVKMAGSIKGLVLDTGNAGGTISFVRADVDLQLSVTKAGKRLLGRAFHGTQERKTQNGMRPEPYEVVAREALEDALNKVADWLESSEMEAALR